MTFALLGCSPSGEQGAENSDSDQSDADRAVDTAVGQELYDIVRAQDLEQLRYLLSDEPSLATLRLRHKSRFHRDFADPTGVMLAGAYGWTEGVNLLLEHGASLNDGTVGGGNAILFSMLYVAKNGEAVEQFVEMCLDAGVDPSITTKSGWTALHCVGNVFPEDVAARLTATLYSLGIRAGCEHHDNLPSPVFHAMTRTYNLGVVREMCRQQPELLQCTSADGETPLVLSIIDDECLWMQTLLEAGADCAESDSRGRSVLHVLCASPHLHDARRECIEAVIQLSRAALENRDNAGDTALLTLVRSSVEDASWPRDGALLTGRALIDSGADLDAQDAVGKTALAIAVDAQVAEWAQLLLACGANADVVDHEGTSAAMLIRLLANQDPDGVWARIMGDKDEKSDCLESHADEG